MIDLKGLFKTGAEKVATAVGKAFDDNFTNREEMARAGIDLEKVKADIIKEANRHLEEIEKQSVEVLKLENQNTSSAREAEVERMKILGRADYFQYLIGIIPVLGLPSLVYYVMAYEIPQRNEHLAMLIIGEVLGFVASIYNYHYGSSMGSRIKDMKK